MEWKVGVYTRVSRDSEYSESNSIDNQLSLIRRYCINNKLDIFETYIDDGYSGTNFNRPGFCKMLNDAREGIINCIIVKDLSRFGRNMGWTQVYLSDLLPELKVRFISINDHIDSSDKEEYYDELDMKFTAMMYEHYAIEGSKKVKQIKHMQQLNGQYIGVSAPYGYLKDPMDNHKLIIDKYAAEIINKIYKMTLELKSKNEIVDDLNKEGIYPPSKYKTEVIKVTSEATKVSSKWTTEMIRQILNNEVYIGNMVQGKITKPRRKSNKRVKTKKEDWIIVENTHEPIISKEDFEAVQRILNYSPLMLKSDDILLRYLKCPDCGSKFYKKKTKYNEYYYCNNYRKKECTNHSIVKTMLEGIVLEDLKSRINKDIKELTKELVEQNINFIYVYDNGKVEIEYKS